MSRKFLTAIDLGKNELQNAAIQSLAGAPSTPVKFQLYGNTGDNTLYWWDGAQWIAAKAAAGATPAGTVTTSAVADSSVVGVSTNFAREDHKHGREAFGAVTSQTLYGQAAANGSATTVAHSDHVHGTPTHVNADHSLISHSALAAPTADVGWGGFKITNLGQPTTGTDAANKTYVDNLAAGLSWKDSVRVATTAAGTLASSFANGQSVDGNTLITGDRILIKNQASAAENGIYTVNGAGAPTRAVDADAVGELEGAAVFVVQGTSQADTAWVNTTDGAITPGTTPTTWAQFGAGTAIVAGAGLLLTTNTLDIQATDATMVISADSIARAALTGDVTTTINAATIAAGVVSNAKLANMTGPTLKGVQTGTAAPSDLAMSTVKTMLAIANTDVTGLGSMSTQNANAVAITGGAVTGITDLVVADGGTGVSTLTGIVKGNGTSAFSAATAGTDYIVPGGALGTPSSGTLTNVTGLPTAGLVNNAVDNTKIADMAAHTFKGNNTAALADPKDLTIAEMQAELGVQTVAALDAVYTKRVALDCLAAATTTVTHNFNSRDVLVDVYATTTPWDTVEVDVKRTTVNTVDVTFATAPSAAAYRIVVVGVDA